MKSQISVLLILFFTQNIFADSLSSVLYAHDHLEALLSICNKRDCNLSDDQKSWLETTKQLAQNLPEVVFKNSFQLENKKFFQQKNEVWINQDLLWIDGAKTISFQISDAVVLWIDILLGDKMISKIELSVLEFEVAQALAIDEKSL